MTDKSKKDTKQDKRAAALRENLKKRKSVKKTTVKNDKNDKQD